MRYLAEYSGRICNGNEVWWVRDTQAPPDKPTMIFKGLKVSQKDALRFAQEWNELEPKTTLRILRKGRLVAKGKDGCDDWASVYRSEVTRGPSGRRGMLEGMRLAA